MGVRVLPAAHKQVCPERQRERAVTPLRESASQVRVLVPALMRYGRSPAKCGMVFTPLYWADGPFVVDCTCGEADEKIVKSRAEAERVWGAHQRTYRQLYHVWAENDRKEWRERYEQIRARYVGRSGSDDRPEERKDLLSRSS